MNDSAFQPNPSEAIEVRETEKFIFFDGEPKKVKLLNLTFTDPWNVETAIDTMSRYIKIVNSTNSNEVILPIINTNGKPLPPSLKIPFASLAKIQIKLGPQVLVGAGALINAFASIIKGLSAGRTDIKSVKTLEEAETLREKIINAGQIISEG